jgi:chemotaxis protein CheZ
MDGYLTKPVALAAIEAAVCKLMPAAALLRQPEQEGVERARSAGLNRDNDAIDVSLLAELIGDDQDAIAEMLDDFLAQAVPLSTAALAQILTDPVEAHRAAHSLKSAARYVGATQLADLAAEVEAALDESRAGEASVSAAQLPAAIDDVAAAVASFRLERQLVSMRAEIGSMADDSGGGFELEAVVEITEEAASKILEAAEAIANRIDALASGDEAALIREQVTAIFEACSFQDLTSQRVRKAIARLTHIEERLDEVVTRFNIADSDSIPAAPGEESRRQDEIDRLLGGD